MFGLVSKKRLSAVIVKLTESEAFREAHQVTIKVQDLNLLAMRKQAQELNLEKINLQAELRGKHNSLTDEIQRLKSALSEEKSKIDTIEQEVADLRAENAGLICERDANGRFLKKNRRGGR